MLDPITFSLNIQKATLEAAAGTTHVLLDNYMKLIDRQTLLMQAGLGRRKQDGKKKRHYRHKGPTLTDHYGKRHHDVDVEKI